MNFRKKQKLRFSARWLKYNKLYWSKWAVAKIEKEAEKYWDFFNIENI